MSRLILPLLSCECKIKKRKESGILSQLCAHHVLRGFLNEHLHLSALTATVFGLWRPLAEVVRALSILEAAGAIADVCVKGSAAIASIKLRHKAWPCVGEAVTDLNVQGSIVRYIVLSWRTKKVLLLEVVVDVLINRS